MLNWKKSKANMKAYDECKKRKHRNGSVMKNVEIMKAEYVSCQHTLLLFHIIKRCFGMIFITGTIILCQPGRTGGSASAQTSRYESEMWKSSNDL